MRKYLIVIFLTMLCFNVFAAAPSAVGIDNIIRKYNPSLNVGILVQSLNTGRVIYQRNATQLFMPASALKVFTGAAALSYLGADYRFQTKILSDGRDLYIYFDGDPWLKRQDLSELIGELPKLGIRSVRNVYLDTTIFDQANFGPGWMWDERNFCYAAPVSAVALDRNCFPVRVTPAKQVGQKATVYRSQNQNFIGMFNQVISQNIASDECPLDLHTTDNNDYYFSGCVAAHSSSIDFLVAVRNMNLYAQKTVEQLLQQRGIQYSAVKLRATPEKLQVVASHSSPPLSSLVKIMLKKSDNLIANSLYKKLGAVYFNRSGTWKNGGKAIAAILGKNSGIDFKRIKIVDGAGLSRYNLVSPTALVQLLNYAYRDQAINFYFVRALPFSGIDGHLAYRMGNLKGRVKAKTGTMKSITSLAGYVDTNRHQVFSFAIIVNDFVEHPRKYQRLEDEICSYLARM